MENINDLKDALECLSAAALSYGDWLAVGMGMKEAGMSCSDWEDWSSRDPSRYKTGECRRKWEGFHGSETPITENSIFKLALDNGWRGSDGHELGWGDEIGTYDRVVVDRHYIEGKPIELPTDWNPCKQLSDYLTALFEPTEIVGYVTQSWKKEDRYIPKNGGCFDRTAGALIEELAACGGDIGKVIGDSDPEAGAWIRFNPLDGKGCKNDNVTEFRYALIESDALEIEEQNDIIHKLELPCAALVYSGKKSLHAIVRVDAPDYAEYRKRVAYLYSVCQKNGLVLDQACRNPSRLSRMPGVMRNGQKQALLETNIGRSNWEEWRDFVESVTDDLPDTEDLGSVWDDLPELSAPLIDGVLRQGHKMLLAGPSKAGKSFALIELCISIAEGHQWLGRFDCAQGKILYINLELDRASYLHRFRDVYQALNVQPAHLHNIDIWNLRGASCPMDKLAPKLIRRASKKGYIAVIIDPIYKVITGDENSADQMAKFCNQFDLVCRELGCAVIYCHHHSKGAQGGKRSMDRASGSGVFARDPDAMLDMTELETTEAVVKALQDRLTCAACKAALDGHGHTDSYSQDDLCSAFQMGNHCKDLLAPKDVQALDERIAAEKQHAANMTAWRIEGTLREFPRFDPVNLWFDYPIHRVEDVLLDDIEPDVLDPRQTGRKGAQKRWDKSSKKDREKEATEKLETAFNCCKDGGEVTVYAMAEYMQLKSETVKRRLRQDGRYWVDGEKVGLK
ncbi:MAG: AAA family ATPase [Clostridiales bacterium]|nr:AAA family ATPase [Clostridiales bacterium]